MTRRFIALAFGLLLFAAQAEPSDPVEKMPSQSNPWQNKKFETKTFGGFGGKSSAFDQKAYPLPSSSPLQGQTANGFSKQYKTPTLALGRQLPRTIFRLDTKLKLRMDGDPFPFKTATLAQTGTPVGFDRKFATKEYTGPEAAKIRRDVEAINKGLLQIKDVPNRTLSIQEVKALLNKDTRPVRPSPSVLPEKP